MNNFSQRQGWQLIQLEFQLRREYSKHLKILKDISEIQGVKEPLMSTVAKYAFDAEQDYLATSDAFHDAGFSTDDGVVGQMGVEETLQILKRRNKHE